MTVVTLFARRNSVLSLPQIIKEHHRSKSRERKPRNAFMIFGGVHPYLTCIFWGLSSLGHEVLEKILSVLRKHVLFFV
jgi:hypothetical protein